MKKLFVLFLATCSISAQAAEMKRLHNCEKVSGVPAVAKADELYELYLYREVDLEGSIDAYVPKCKKQMNEVSQTGVDFDEYIRTQENMHSDLESAKSAESDFKTAAAKANKILKHYKEEDCSTQIDRFIERVNVGMKENREKVASCKVPKSGSASLQPSNSVKPTNCSRMLSLTGSGHSSSCQCPSGMAYIELSGMCTYNR